MGGHRKNSLNWSVYLHRGPPHTSQPTFGRRSGPPLKQLTKLEVRTHAGQQLLTEAT